jgi:hypothetical protein
MQAGDWDAWVGCKLRHGFYRWGPTQLAQVPNCMTPLNF